MVSLMKVSEFSDLIQSNNFVMGQEEMTENFQKFRIINTIISVTNILTKNFHHSSKDNLRTLRFHESGKVEMWMEK